MVKYTMKLNDYSRKEVEELISKFISTYNWDQLEIRVLVNGIRQELTINCIPAEYSIQHSSEVTSKKETLKETLTEKLTRIRAIPPEQLQGEELNWWKNIQQTLSSGGTRPQIILQDTNEEALKKLEGAGITE